MTYTHDELYSMPAGRDLDAAVATTFFGWRWMQYQATTVSVRLTGIFPPGLPDIDDWRQPWSDSDRHQPRMASWDNHATYPDRKAILLPRYSTQMQDAWLVVTHLRDMWTAATESVGNNDDFARPFADTEFFEHLHRHADRRWPWAMLYMSPDAICRAALLSVSA